MLGRASHFASYARDLRTVPHRHCLILLGTKSLFLHPLSTRIVVMGSFRVLSKTLGSLGISAMTNEGSLNRKLESPRRYTRTFFPASLATELALNHTESGVLETGIHWNFASSLHIRRPKHCLSVFCLFGIVFVESLMDQFDDEDSTRVDSSGHLVRIQETKSQDLCSSLST